MIGAPVQANTELLIVHCGTQEYLSNDFINYSNQFGQELEVSAKRIVEKHNGQQLYGESVGKKVINLAQKKPHDNNIWQILTATDPKAAEPVAAP